MKSQALRGLGQLAKTASAAPNIIIKVIIPSRLTTLSYIISPQLQEQLARAGRKLENWMLVVVPLKSSKLLGIISEITPGQSAFFGKTKKGKAIYLKEIDSFFAFQGFKPGFIRFLRFFSHYNITKFEKALELAFHGASLTDPFKYQDIISLAIEEVSETHPAFKSPKRLARLLSCFKPRSLKESVTEPLLSEGGSAASQANAANNDQAKAQWVKSALSKAAKVDSAFIEQLIKHGILHKEKRRVTSFDGFAPDLAPARLLKGEQKKAATIARARLEQLNLGEPCLSEQASPSAAQKQQKRLPLLIDGVTGSGKTEVYFAAIHKALELQKQVLVLVPEIALTKAFLARFVQRFNLRPGEWHSTLAARQRQEVWRGALSGEISIVVGARSALFLPFKNLGLIVIDEEHDSCYKQDALLGHQIAYNARDMAVVRAAYENALLILASATPALESYYNARHKKCYELIELKKRYKGARFAENNWVDKPLNEPFMHPALLHAIGDNLAKGEQSLLFLNSRAYSPYTICPNCGFKVKCEACEAFLAYHREDNCYKCHYCDFTKDYFNYCPKCKDRADLPFDPHFHEKKLPAPGAIHVLEHKFVGIERIAEILKKLYPEAKLALLSSDVSSSPAKMDKALADISQRNVDIIIGTQLVTKGHNFPQLTLVGVLDADLSKKATDFRALERIFQMLIQVIGRAGRRGEKSRSFIQANSLDKELRDAIDQQDKVKFYELLLKERQIAKCPPFARWASLIVISPVKEKARIYAQKIASLYKSLKPELIQLDGPEEAPLFMLEKRYRYRLLFKMPFDENINKAAQGKKNKQWALQTTISDIIDKAGPCPAGVHLQIDMDPQSFL